MGETNSSNPTVVSNNLSNAEVNGLPHSSTSTDQTKVGGKRKPSPVWNKGNFTQIKKPDGTIDPNNFICEACKVVVPCNNKSNGTSSCWAHARNCKLNPLYDEANKNGAKCDKTQQTLNMDNMYGAILHHQFNQKRTNERCVEMIIRDELAFRFVEGSGFRAFCSEIQPRFKIPGRKKIAGLVLEKYAIEKYKLISQLTANSTRVSITTDTWTSIQNINYLVVTAHFMDSDWKLHKRIISFCAITSHKGEDIGRVLESCLRQSEIIKIYSITVDNASAKISAVEHIKKDGIKELENGIQAIWNCVKYIRSSPSRLKKFREIAVLEHMRENANVPLDVATRWNSTYFMLDATLKFETVCTRMADEDIDFQNYFNEVDKNGKTRVGPPLESEWRDAQAFIVFLKRFYESTLKLSAWKSVTINLVFVEMIGLQLEIERRLLSTDSVMRKVAASMKGKFDKYWGLFELVNKIIFVANVLDPRYKIQYYTKAIGKLGTLDTIIAEKALALKNILVKMYKEYKSNIAGASRMGKETELENWANRFALDDADGLDDILAECLQERLDQQNESICNEVDQYLSDKCIAPYRGLVISAWWKNHESVYPVLSCLAKDIFAVPCSTVPSENAFSLGSRIVDPFRSSLTPHMVEAFVCCSDWLRAEEVNFFKEPTEEELELYAALEESERGM